MDDQALPLKLEGKPVRAPRDPASGKSRPQWSDYHVKNRIQCDHCVLNAYDSAMTGQLAIDGIRSARFKRVQDRKVLLLCAEHAQMQRQIDARDFPPGQHERRSSNGAGQKYLA